MLIAKIESFREMLPGTSRIDPSRFHPTFGLCDGWTA
jgi:hypothetical protein